jgi:hypothetical protein
MPGVSCHSPPLTLSLYLRTALFPPPVSGGYFWRLVFYYADSPCHVGFRPTQIGTSLIAVNLPNETNDGPYPPLSPAPSELGVRAEL